MKHRGGRTISKTLKEVLVNPETGRYTLNISLNYMGDTQESFNLQYKTEDLEFFFVAARINSEFLPPYRQIPLAYYKSLIERGDEDILLAILLPPLPNLRSLKFSRVSSDRGRCWISHIFHYLPHVNTWTLTKLSTININIGDIYFHFDEAKAHAYWPLVKSLSAFRLCCGGQNHASSFSTPNSNITKLELWDCRVPAKLLQEFLPEFHSLLVFSYFCDLPEYLADTFDVFLIRSALLANARKTLRKLTILAGSQPSSVIGTLRPFKVLDEVCTEWRLLLLDSWRTPRHGPELPLAMSLPDSLRKLGLYDEVGRGTWNYNNLVNDAVRAQKWGTQFQPQPYEARA